MKAKLIKVLEHYHLYDGDKAIATTIIGNPMLLPNLSLKNCQAIEDGYDLDELSRNYGNKDADITNDFGKGHREGCYMGYLAGFQKALEILGNKKFSEDDVNLAFVLGKNKDESRINKLINSRLQQTEWDVEIVMGDPIGIGDKYTPDTKPKLDADGCLILKRIKE